MLSLLVWETLTSKESTFTFLKNLFLSVYSLEHMLYLCQYKSPFDGANCTTNSSWTKTEIKSRTEFNWPWLKSIWLVTFRQMYFSKRSRSGLKRRLVIGEMTTHRSSVREEIHPHSTVPNPQKSSVSENWVWSDRISSWDGGVLQKLPFINIFLHSVPSTPPVILSNPFQHS